MGTSKVLRVLILFFLYFVSFSVLYAEEEINIISREQWGADEWYRYLDSEKWQKILKKWEETPKRELTEYQKKLADIKAKKVKKANNYLINNHSNIFWIKNIVKQEDGHKLAWPIAYSNKKVAIIIHHTDSEVWEGGDNYKVMRDIYKYHSITRWWWDIGYNFLVWTNWEIFEWRAWWDYVVWAHDKWNNQATIWVSLIWNYSGKEASAKQMESLKKLIKYLIKKYNINIKRKMPFFKWCLWVWEKCIEKPLIISYEYPIIGHRDAWHTTCPWEKLYAQMQEMKKELWVWISIKDRLFLKKMESKLKDYKENKLLKLLSNIELLLDNDDIKNKDIILWIKDIILKIEKEKNIYNIKTNNSISFDDNNKIKVKLSYPKSDYISLKISKELSLKFIKKENEYLLNFINSWKINKKDSILKFNFKDNKIFIKNKEIINFNKIEFLRIKVPVWNIIEINSWDRKPLWDKTWKLNDNQFRWDIVLYSKEGKLIVVNELYLNDYLKWLWEVSNSTNPEKIKTIIILARTYARWYMTKVRKFAGEWFDASDDPNVFQKYLWFGLEKRSPKINKIVEETKDLVVTFDWELIKPWYFSSSDWETKSFIEYCKNAKWIPDCSAPEKFPFLVWVVDNWWIWRTRAWHWVWVPWTWVQYFSERWWNFYMIIKYFLKWTKIERK